MSMEIGNMIFGNSRGEVPVDRNPEWTEALQRLFDAIAGGDGDYHGEEFDNDIFRCCKYWWGECTCLLAEREAVWLSQHPHAQTCPTLRHSRDNALDPTDVPGVYTVDLSALVGPQCDCGQWGAFAKWEAEQTEEHESECRTVLPNFHYKPSDYRLSWYKYPLRDSYASRAVDTKEFLAMVEAAIASVQAMTPTTNRRRDR